VETTTHQGEIVSLKIGFQLIMDILAVAFITQVVEEKGNQQNTILGKLHVMNKKIDVLCREYSILKFMSTLLQTFKALLWRTPTYPNL
jgi:hypothetical protein